VGSITFRMHHMTPCTFADWFILEKDQKDPVGSIFLCCQAEALEDTSKHSQQVSQPRQSDSDPSFLPLNSSSDGAGGSVSEKPVQSVHKMRKPQRKYLDESAGN